MQSGLHIQKMKKHKIFKRIEHQPTNFEFFFIRSKVNKRSNLFQTQNVRT